MIAKFFIDRPIFAWVIALIILLTGVIALRSLPISLYPTVAPPALTISATYPGASAQVVEETVVSLIEQEMNGLDNLLYMESASQVGSGSVVLTFKPGTSADYASVEAQNRIKRIEARLPDEVRRLGIIVNKTSQVFVMFAAITSSDGRLNSLDLSSYAAANLVDPLRRVPGVSETVLFGTEYSMRIWLNTQKMEGYRISPADISNAIRAQNTQLATGEIGSIPALPRQETNAVIVTNSRLSSPEEFGNILLRTNPDGSTLRIKDVARVELGGQTYATSARLDGKPTAALAIRLKPESNALETVKAVRAKLEELERFAPKGVKFIVPLDTTRFIDLSIHEVLTTLIEAIILVFLVMFLFLGSWRATLIPTIVVPIALMGGTLGLWIIGYSINVLTLFAMVLAIGIVVDDAIVVVENVERLMATEGLSPREATRKAMDQIVGAIIAITLVLSAVFVPMAFFEGATGAIYRQFSVTLVITIFFSALLALTLTPALCATLLKPMSIHPSHGLIAKFNVFFDRVTTRYAGWVSRSFKKTLFYLFIYSVILLATLGLYAKLPGSFLPEEDQGNFLTIIQLPPGATQERTLEVVRKVEAFYAEQPEIKNAIDVIGFSFFGNGQNTALAFVMLKDWSERKKPENSSQAIVQKANIAFSRIKEAMIFSINPPSIPEVAAVGGFDFRLQDQSGLGRAALLEGRNMLLGMAMQDPRLTGIRPEGMEDAPQLFLDVDRVKTEALGVAISDLNETLQSALGTAYINDFIRQGRILRVQMQADSKTLSSAEDVLSLTVRNDKGRMVPLSELAKPRWIVASPKLDRYNGLPAMKIGGSPAAGYSTSQAMAVMEELAQKLPPGLGFEWSGISFEERLAGSQAPALFAVSLIVVFLCLAALFESWTVPLAVILVVPLGVFGAALAVTLRGLPNDVYFKVGLIAIIGLSSKNAILIVEFARTLQDEGKTLLDATIEACRLRLRPILMTSIAFIAGVIPLALSTGAGAESRHAIGTGVVGGMVAATILAIFLVPIFFVVVRRIFPGHARKHEEAQDA